MTQREATLKFQKAVVLRYLDDQILYWADLASECGEDQNMPGAKRAVHHGSSLRELRIVFFGEAGLPVSGNRADWEGYEDDDEDDDY